MKKLLHGKILIIVSILALITAIIAVADGVMNVLEILILTKESNNPLMSEGTISLGVDVLFAAYEISFGYKLLKAIRNDEHFESYKQIPGLIKSIITPFFAIILVDVGFAIFDKAYNDGNIITGPLLVLLILYFAITIVSSQIREAVLKRKLQTLNVITIILSVLSLGYLGFIYKDVINFDSLLNGISNILNIIIIILILIYGILSIVYYVKHPNLLISESRENEDSEIIKETDKYKVYKIYLLRTNHPRMNLFTRVLNIIIGTISLVAGIYFFINRTLIYIKEFDLNEIILGFKNLSLIFDTIYYIYELMFSIMIPLILVTGFASLLTYALTSDGRQRFSRLSLVQAGYLLSITFIITQIISLAFNFGNLSLGYFLNNYSIGDLLIIFPAIIFFIIGKYVNNLTSDIQKGFKNGDPYHEHINPITKLTILYAILSSITVVGFLAKQNFIFDLALYALILIHLLVVITALLEKKYPCEEYVKAKRKI